MSDAGKVMIGTDGNPLLSADGKIVLADDLYPMWLSPAVTEYARFADGDDLSPPNSCPAADVWSASWGSTGYGGLGTWFFGISADDSPGETSWVQQKGIVLTFGTDNIDWSRTKAIKIRMTVDGQSPSGLSVKVTTAKNITDGIMPSGDTIRDSWTLAGTYQNDFGSQTLEITHDTGGVKPDNVGIAAFFDVSTCPLGGEYGTEYYEIYNSILAGSQLDPPIPTIQVIYNLAA
jgi:hypothetical protein